MPTGGVIALDAKMSAPDPQSVRIPPSFKKLFPDVEQITYVTFSGQNLKLSKECSTVPITELHDFLESV